MKQLFYLFTLLLGLLSCGEKPHNSTVSQKENTVKLRKLKKLFVVGDFDGDGKQDTIFQHNFSRLKNTEIEYAADPFQNEFDTVIYWFYDQDADLFLTLNKHNYDTLHLSIGTAQGLYCLINIGDNNADGKDEIAFVVDYLDFSMVSRCLIYTLCQGKWVRLKEFSIYEEAFSFTNDRDTIFNTIKDFLEKKNGKWVYKDYYSELDYDNEEDVGKMFPLKLGRCE